MTGPDRVDPIGYIYARTLCRVYLPIILILNKSKP
jgi:hypothetical protein